MAGDEKETKTISETNFLNGQTDEAKVKFLYRSKDYPNNTIMPKQTKYQSERESQIIYLIIANSHQMRLNVINMEINVLKTFCIKQLIDNEKDTWQKIQNIETSISIVSSLLKINNFEKAESELLIAENLSTELMKKIKKVLNKDIKKKDVQKLEEDIEVPDYRSIVTVRGTEEDVINCISKATIALENGKYDRAESLLLKAERIFPTVNARNLLQEVWTAKKLKQNSKLIVKAALANKEEKPNKEIERANREHNTPGEPQYKTTKIYDTYDSRVVERNLNDVRSFDPSLDLFSHDNFEHDKLEGAYYPFQCNADSKTITPPPKNQAKDLTSMAENAIQNKKIEDAINVLDTAEKNKPISQVIYRNVSSNCYEFPVEANESNASVALEYIESQKANTLLGTVHHAKRNTSMTLNPEENIHEYTNNYSRSEEINEYNKCIKLMSKAFHEGNLAIAELFLKKATRMNPNDEAKKLLKNIQDIRESQSSSDNLKREKETEMSVNLAIDAKITLNPEKNIQEYTNNYSRSEEINEYDKCIKLMSKAIHEGNLAKAEHFVKKAIRMNPNDKAKKQLKNIQDIRASQSNEAEMLVDLAIDANSGKKFGVARYYMERALQKHPNEKSRKQLQNLKIEIERQNGCRSLPVNFKNEANKLLDKSVNYIRIPDIGKAEFFLNISWDMSRSGRTISVYKEFLKARMALLSKEDKNRRNGKNDGNSENIIQSDRLVMLALNKYERKRNRQAEELLMKALKFHPSVQIDKLLGEIKSKSADDRSSNTFCSIL